MSLTKLDFVKDVLVNTEDDTEYISPHSKKEYF